MPRTHIRKTVDINKVNQMVQEAVEKELEGVESMVEEIIEAKVRPPMSKEEKLVGLNTYRPKTPVNPKQNRHTSSRVSPGRMALPQYIERMDEGEQKQKTIKAAAQAALILGQPVNQVALQYGIQHEVALRWEQTILTMSAAARRDRLSDMLLIFIEQELKSLLTIGIVTSKEEWVMRQNAADLAHFIAAKTDRILLLLSAFGRADETRKRYMDQLEVINPNG